MTLNRFTPPQSATGGYYEYSVRSHATTARSCLHLEIDSSVPNRGKSEIFLKFVYSRSFLLVNLIPADCSLAYKAFSEHVDLHTGFYFLDKNFWIDIRSDIIEKIVDEVGFI